MTVSFIIQMGTLLGAKQGGWHHSPAAGCPGPPYLRPEQRRGGSGWEETGARAAGLLPHARSHSFTRSFVHPATRALADTWGPMEESPPLNSRRGRRDVYQGEQTPRGAPEANSLTPSTAGAQHDAPHSDTGDSPADAGGDLALMGQVGALGHHSGGWVQVCTSGFVSNDPLCLRVTLMTCLSSGSVWRDTPQGHSGLGVHVSALGTLAQPRDLGMPPAFSLCSVPLSADSPVSNPPWACRELR